MAICRPLAWLRHGSSPTNLECNYAKVEYEQQLG
jgi:hypothetical protein